MSLGMMNSGATLTRAVKKLLCGMDNVVDYIDDLLVHTETWEAHVETLAELFRRLRVANFTVRLVKCVLGSSTIDFLGHRLGQGTISLQDENVEKSLCKHIREVLGIRRHIRDYNPWQPRAIYISMTPTSGKKQPHLSYRQHANNVHRVVEARLEYFKKRNYCYT
ncbi:zinc finger protein [Elysia marginata]|uniref:Zinc finger protein n=1 Tax=Elysia marginata TaxID=1093978 RepID=A0AAV4EXU4_9GAST|nr:zinc finger protein [Elysia marginata]